MKKIEWNQIDIKSNARGEVNTTCPACSHTRTKKKDKCLRVNVNKGLAFCHHCNGIAIKNDSLNTIVKKDYKLPEQKWTNTTDMSDSLIKYCESRRISQQTLEDLRVSEELYFQPQAGVKMNNIVFNYFEGDTLINKKFRSGAKHFTQLTGCKPLFYNINAIINSNEVYIVEGEFDVLAMHEAGYKNTISIPNGANDNDDFWINSEVYLKNVSKFYIATDNDDKGEAVAEKIVQRLGRYRCERILFNNKDANGDLLYGGKLLVEESINKSKKYPSIGTYTIDDLMEEILLLHKEGVPKTYYPKHKSFGKLKDIFSVMRGHLVTATGIPSHGKSNFVEWYVMNLVRDYDMKASFFSPEHHPMSLHQSTFIEKFHGKNFFQDNPGLPRVSVEDIERYRKWASERIYITTPDKGEFPTWNWLLDKFKEQMFIYGIDIFVIDAFNKVEFNDTKANDLSNIRRVLTKLTTFCQLNDVIVFLVAHPKKMRKSEDGSYDIPTLYDISGSADFRNMTHDGMTVYRYFSELDNGERVVNKNQVEIIVEKVKMKFQGSITDSEILNYHIPSGRYYANSYMNPPLFKFDEDNLNDKEEVNFNYQSDLPF